MSGSTFKDLERQGWTEKAAAYDQWFARITGAAIGSTLDALEPLQGQALLDVSTGTGHIAAEAARRAAEVVGIDFAPTMIEAAKRNHPDIDFVVGDAEALDFPAASFDRVACGFGLLHFGNPDAAIAEARRVLRAGGRYAFTVWCGPEQGGDLFRLVTEAITANGTMAVDLPPAPPWFRFAEPMEVHRTLTEAGFINIDTRVLDLAWHPSSGEEVIEMIQKSTVRTPMLIDRQTPVAREQIHRSIVAGAAKLGLRIRMPALLASAGKPA
jgi:SAM-dependent methyltransferase